MPQSYPQYVDIALQEKAVSLWKSGQLVAFPTETVYGLGADASNDEAVARIFAAKSRPRFNPLIVHVGSVEIAKIYGQWSEAAEILAHNFWPGPLTIVLKKSGQVSDLVTAGGDSIGLRIPRHKIALELLKAYGGGIAAPSANRSGRISPTCAAHVQAEFAEAMPFLIDGGQCEVGLESTVIDITQERPILWRAGGIPRAQIERVLCKKILMHQPARSDATLVSPGQLESHYAPTKPVRLDVTQCSAQEGLLAFGTPIPKGAGALVQLSASGNLQEAATKLFASLRELDAALIESIAVMPIPNEGLGEAINDRLRRAAAPR